MVDESSQTSSEHHIVVTINFFKSHLDYNIDNLIDDLWMILKFFNDFPISSQYLN